MNVEEDLVEAVARYQCGLSTLEEIRIIAESRFETTAEFEPLLALIDLPDSASHQQVEDSLRRALNSLGLELPNVTEARRICARYLARKIISKEVSAYAGARAIWWRLWTDCRGLDEPSVFAGLASEIEDARSEATKEAYEQDIILEAQKLLAT